MDRLHVKQEKSHGRNSTPPPLATSAKLCLIDHRYLDTSRSYGTQDRSISTVYSCPFNQLSLIVIERHTRFLQSKQGTEVDEPNAFPVLHRANCPCYQNLIPTSDQNTSTASSIQLIIRVRTAKLLCVRPVNTPSKSDEIH